MHIESSNFIMFLNDSHSGVDNKVKETRKRANELYDIYPQLKAPFPYHLPFGKGGNKSSVMDFEDLIYNANKNSDLPQSTETMELVLGLSERLRLKYAEINKDEGRIILGVLDKDTGDVKKITLDPLALRYDFKMDLSTGLGTSTIVVDATEKAVYTYERIGLFNAPAELLWKKDY